MADLFGGLEELAMIGVGNEVEGGRSVELPIHLVYEVWFIVAAGWQLIGMDEGLGGCSGIRTTLFCEATATEGADDSAPGT